LGRWSAVNGDDDRGPHPALPQRGRVISGPHPPLLQRRRVLRAIDRGMELNAIAIAEAMELRRWKLGVGTLGRVKDDIRLCREASHRHARRLTGAVPGVDEAAEVGRDLREVDSRIASDPLHRSALERHPEDVPLQWALL